MTKSTRAPAGGTTGMNGLTYEGGQFLPNTTMGKITKAARKAATRKEQIAPYVWEVAPVAGMRSIFSKYGGVWSRVNAKDGSYTFKLCPTLNPEYFTNEYMLKAQTMADRWNAGERWIGATE